MNNTTDSILKIIQLATKLNRGISTVLCPVLYFNGIVILFLSISWSLYLFNEILKVSLKYKKILKSRNFISEHQWLHDVRNLYSKKVRNIFLIAICMSECIILLSILAYEILYMHARHVKIKKIDPLSSSDNIFGAFRVDFGFYYSMNHTQLRIFGTLITTSFYTLFLSVRILTQYLVHQYSYYKFPFWFKFKLAISLLIITTLFICGVVRQLVLIHFIVLCLLLYTNLFVSVSPLKSFVCSSHNVSMMLLCTRIRVQV